jgi:hypothetical protein
MHRMRRYIVPIGLAVCSFVFTAPATASLLKPDAGRSYPDIAADINGKVTYTYDPNSQTGVFLVTNTPYLIAGGSTSSQEYSVNPDSVTGIRQQSLSVTLNSSGQFVSSATNNYELWGTIVADGTTYSGLLLKGAPTAFGAQDLGAAGVQGSDIFDVSLKISGGALASFFGSDAYMRITPELLSTFQGKFDENFSAQKATSNTRTYNPPHPFPVPEPASMLVMLVGVGGLVIHHRRRARRV